MNETLLAEMGDSSPYKTRGSGLGREGVWSNWRCTSDVNVDATASQHVNESNGESGKEFGGCTADQLAGENAFVTRKPSKELALCRHFMRGHCIYGDRCSFKHDSNARATADAARVAAAQSREATCKRVASAAMEAELLAWQSFVKGLRHRSGWNDELKSAVDELNALRERLRSLRATVPVSRYATRNRLRNLERAGALRRFMIELYGLEALRAGSGVIDVAGGQGALAFEMANLNSIPVTVVDPRPLSLKRLMRKWAVMGEAGVNVEPFAPADMARVVSGGASAAVDECLRCARAVHAEWRAAALAANANAAAKAARGAEEAGAEAAEAAVAIGAAAAVEANALPQRPKHWRMCWERSVWEPALAAVAAREAAAAAADREAEAAVDKNAAATATATEQLERLSVRPHDSRVAGDAAKHQPSACARTLIGAPLDALSGDGDGSGAHDSACADLERSLQRRIRQLCMEARASSWTVKGLVKGNGQERDGGGRDAGEDAEWASDSDAPNAGAAPPHGDAAEISEDAVEVSGDETDPCHIRDALSANDTTKESGMLHADAAETAGGAISGSSSRIADETPTASHVISTLADCAAICGMHPDGATEAIVDFALAARVPFAVVPCCVYSNLFPDRRDGVSGRRVTSYDHFVNYLVAKDAARLRVATLPFEGKNKVVYVAPESLRGWARADQQRQLTHWQGPAQAQAQAQENAQAQPNAQAQAQAQGQSQVQGKSQQSAASTQHARVDGPGRRQHGAQPPQCTQAPQAARTEATFNHQQQVDECVVCE